MNIPIEEQLDAYTSFQTTELFKRYGVETKHQGMFTADGRDIRDCSVSGMINLSIFCARILIASNRVWSVRENSMASTIKRFWNHRAMFTFFIRRP
jgi:hypothetical protein